MKEENRIDVKINILDLLKNIVNKEEQYTIPIFIPHRGCPNECVFCNQRKISGMQKNVTTKEVDNIISKYLEYFDDNKKIQVAFFGGSFTGIDINSQIEYLKIANKYIKSGKVDSIRISTRPDYISPTILKVLKKYNVRNIELGVQSMDNEVLRLSKRGHDNISVIRASLLIRYYGFKLGHQMMIGLPGSNEIKEIETIKSLLKLKPDELRIYPVYVINPSELYDMYVLGKYVPLTLEEAISRTYVVLRECKRSNVRIIRIGLQSTDEITSNNLGLVGPVCDNFAEYVMAKVVCNVIEENIKNKLKEDMINEIIIHVPLRYASIVVGPKKVNKEYLINKYKKYNLKIKLKGEE